MNTNGIDEIAGKIKSGELKSEALVNQSLERIKEKSDLNAYVSVFNKDAVERSRKIDEKVKKGETLGRFAGIPIAVKDNMVFRQGQTTCGSRMLQHFNSPYNATVVDKLLKEDAIIVGKTNMDEFAMGSTSENSAFGPVKNPIDNECVPGGSSGGSAVSVASGTVMVSLGSDTGGSIRQPAAWCGTVGLKPTYGRVSRYGLVAFASSLDQIGPFANNVRDAAALLEVVSGWDPADNTSVRLENQSFSEHLGKGLAGKTIGVPKEYFSDGLNTGIRSDIEQILARMEKNGAKLKEISLPHMKYGIAAYYILASAEASANLARYDGVRYGYRSEKSRDLLSLYANTRGEGFGLEVKRRIILGTYVLSSGFYDAYYLKAQKIRRLITDDFNQAFNQCDVIATPTAPSLPSKAGQLLSDPLAMYLQDLYTVGVSLAGLPAISLPVGKSCFPSGMQLIGKTFEESSLLQIADAAEKINLG